MSRSTETALLNNTKDIQGLPRDPKQNVKLKDSDFFLQGPLHLTL